MKSLKALEQKYKLINEANVPVAATPRAATPPAAPATQPVPQPVVQPSILSAEELKKLNDPNSPIQPSKIEAIAKDPQQLKAFEQNELPGIIDGLVASIAQTNPEALKELHDAAKANDVNKVNALLLKYSQATGAVPQESVDLNTEGWGDVWNGIKEFASSILNFFKQNSKLVYGALGLMIAGPLGAAALPLLATAIEKGNWGSGGGGTSTPSISAVIAPATPKANIPAAPAAPAAPATPETPAAKFTPAQKARAKEEYRALQRKGPNKRTTVEDRKMESLKGIINSSYTPFGSQYSKVLKEFYRDSKPLPIEIANKK